jgi:hypothetical protein
VGPGGLACECRDNPANGGVAILTHPALFTDWQHPRLYYVQVARQGGLAIVHVGQLRARAGECRACAKLETDTALRDDLLSLADDCDRIANELAASPMKRLSVSGETGQSATDAAGGAR